MAIFYFNRHSGEDIYSQWVQHIQNNAYIKDVDNIIAQNRRELEYALNNGSKEQVNAINSVCGKLDEGFAVVTSYLSNIDFNISELRTEMNAMSAMLDWRLSQLIEEQRITNQLLGQITQLLRIPDSQKQRVYYIEQGLKYLKNAILEGANSTFFIDALESFKESEKIEKKDFITLNRIGYIFLYSINHFNPGMAEEYFLRSSREAYAEAMIGGTSTANNFSPDGINFHLQPNASHQNSKEQLKSNQDQALHNHIIEISKSQDIQSAIQYYKEKKFGGDQYRFVEARECVYKVLINNEATRKTISSKNGNSYSYNYSQFLIAAAESNLYAGRACYLQQNIPMAIEYVKKALNLIPEFLEASFELSKYLSVNDQNEEAASTLESVILKDRLYSRKAVLDNDLLSNNLIIKLLEKLKTDAVSKAKSEFNECKTIMIKKSKALEIVNKIDLLVQQNNYLSALEALGLLNTEYQLPISIFINGGPNVIRFEVNPRLHIVDFLIQEKKYSEKLKAVQSEANETLVKGIIMTYAVRGGFLGLFIGFILGCFSKKFSLDLGTLGFSAIIVGGAGALLAAILTSTKKLK